MIKVVVLLVTFLGVVMAKPSFYPGGLFIPSSVSNTYRQDIIKLPYPTRGPQILPSTTPSSQPMNKPTLPVGVVPKPPTTNGTAPALRPYQPPSVIYVVPANQPAPPVLLVDCPPVIQYW